MKKSIIKYLTLGIGGLLGLSCIFGPSLSNQFASKEESINIALADEGTKLPTGGGSLASGTYYLDSDMTLTNYITVASGNDVVINLNGYSLSAKPNSSQNIAYVNGGTLTVNGKNDVSGNMGTLCNGTGYHDGSYTRGGAIAIYNGGEVTVNDCNIRDNVCNFAGAIFVSAGTTATLNNCNVYNNVTNNPYGYRGVIYVEGVSAKAYINGGEIYGNSAGVYLFDGTANRSPYAKLNGVYIHDNLQYGVAIERNNNGNPPLTIAGDTIIKNNSTQVTTGARANLRINNTNDAKIEIDSELGLGDNAYIGITLPGDKTGSKAVFTNSADTSYNDASKFFSDDTNYVVGKNADGQLLLGTPVTATYVVVNGTWVGGSSDPIDEEVASGGVPQNVPTGMIPDTGYNAGTWDNNPSSTINSNTTFTYTFGDYVASITNGGNVTCYTDFATALSNWTDGTTLTLYKDVTVSSTTSINNTCTLDLNGYGIRATGNDYRFFTINSSGYLTVIDSDPTHAHAITLSNYRGTSVADGTGTTDVTDGTGTTYVTGGYITGGYSTNSSAQYGIGFYLNGGQLDLYGGTIIGNYLSVSNCAGAGAFLENGARLRMYDGGFIYNYAQNSAGGIVNKNSTFEIYGGTIAYNKNAFGGGVAIQNLENSTLKIYGGTIEYNTHYNTDAAVKTNSNMTIGLKGSPVVIHNQPAGLTDREKNILIYNKIQIEGPLTNTSKIGITLDNNGAGDIWTNGSGIFTERWSTYMSGKDPADYFFSDNPDYHVYLKDGEACLGTGHTVTFNTNGRGIAPDPVIVDDGSLVNKPTDPTVEGYEVKGWYKEAECENIWDFDNDVVSNDITLYAKWDYDEATANAIKLINDIGTLTYDGGSNDSLADILAAKTAYDALTPGRKVIVDGVNKNILDHDITTYRNVDKVGDLINAIPEPSPDKSYYDAIDLAITEYNKLTEEEITILNSVINYQEFLNDNIAARKVIIEIEEIGEVTYDGGIDDSKKDIEKAEKSYEELTKDQKDIVDYVNHDVLVDDREIYDQLDKAIKAIKDIGKVDSGDTTKEKLEEARDAYDALPDELKEFVKDYDNSLKVLEDDEKVYEALVLIDEIGDVGYDSASQEKIQKARTYYDSLSDDQKELIAPEALRALEEKESAYNALSNKGNTTLLVLYIIFGILLLVGIIYFFFLVRKKKNNDDNDSGSNDGNKGAVKVASFTGLTPFIIYASHYLDAGYILLYVIIALTVIVWATDLAILIYKKTHKNEKVVEEAKQVETTKPEDTKPRFEKEPEPVNEDEEEVVTITDEKGNIFNIRYIKSFTAKLIQSPDETKKYYEELKNYVLSYKKTTSRVSWHYDSINSGRNQVLKFAIRGKTLCLYYPLNVEDYNDTKYKVEAVDSKKFEEVPCLYRIKNDRRLGYAKDLIDAVMNNLGLVKGEEQHEVYSDLPYEENKPLIARGLIKEQKIQVNKPVEQVVSKKVNDEGDEIVTTKDNKGNYFEIRYIKSFLAKLSQASDETKAYYNELKNYVLTYKGVHSRVSWHFDSINVGRNQVIKFSIRGKTLCVYYALNANDYLDTKYKVEAVDSKKFEEVPCLYRIKNDRRRDYAKDLIDTVMANVPTIKGKDSNEDFRIPYESTKALLAKGLIKENKVQVNKPVEDKPVEQMSEDEEEVITITDEKGNIFNIRYIKSFTAKLIQSPDETKKYYEELKNYVLSYKKTTSRVSWHYDSVNSGRNQVLKFAIRGKTLCVYYPLNASDYLDTKYKVEAVDSKKFEEVPCLYRIKNDRRLDYAKDLIDTVMNNLGLVKGEEQHEIYSDLPYEPNAPLIARGLIKELKVQVNKPVAPVVIKAEEVDVKMSDEEATSQIKEDSGSKKHVGKKGIVNIDVIAKSFTNNEVVNIESLWEKKIISKNIGHVKVLARGSLDKKLNFELQDYSLQAVKMILLTGGTVKRVK